MAIAPGIATGAESLFNAGAMLPAVDLHKPEKVIGKNTILSLQSGIIYGAAGMVEGLVRASRRNLAAMPKWWPRADWQT